MDPLTINIAGKESIDLECPRCGHTRRIIVSKLPDIGKVYKVKCQCEHEFFIAFDRRQFKRKRVNFIGTYSLKNGLSDNIINIIDVSRGGIAFVRSDKTKLSIGDKIIVRFNLDNSEGDLIECVVLIRNIFDNRVCVEYLDMGGRMRTTLGFYFLET